MFGIGFTEILLIAIIAILFLGPDKLPEAMVQIAKFIKSVKKTVGEAKNSLDEELRIADLKEEALNYKQQLDSATDELKSFKNIGLEDDLKELIYDTDTQEIHRPTKGSPYADMPPASSVETPSDTVTFKKKSKKKKKNPDENSAKTEKKTAKKSKNDTEGDNA